MSPCQIHSHVCGRSHILSENNSRWYDSFPRKWDNPSDSILDLHELRYIPTRVGQTQFLSLLVQKPTIHSHSRGTNKVRPIFGVVEPDSLPLAWDKLKLYDRFLNKYRFTPTHVVQTLQILEFPFQIQIHSHSRGTIIYRQDINIQSSVSFPRMWDKPVSQSFPCIHARLIPTRFEPSAHSTCVG